MILISHILVSQVLYQSLKKKGECAFLFSNREYSTIKDVHQCNFEAEVAYVLSIN